MSIPVFSSKCDATVLIPQRGVNGKWGYVDADGNFRIKPNYEKAFDFKEGLALVSLFNKFGYIDANGRPIISLQYDGAKSFSEGLAAVMIYDQKQNKKWGYIDKTGRFVIFPRYDTVSDFSDGKALVKADNDEFVINKSGDIIKE
jgi:hypothetical protein